MINNLLKEKMSINNPLVSIVIPAYNASNYLAQAIDSALAQTYPNIEIIVVNDGSKDNGATEQVALSYGNKIRYFHKENGGSSSAINVGIANMTGEWFSWLSHDDLYMPNKIEEQINYMKALNVGGFIYRHIFFSASELIDANGKTIRKSDLSKAKKIEAFLEVATDNALLIAEPTNYSFHGCSCLIHKSAFAEVGTFDEQLRLLNDVDMWYRLYAKGYIVHYLPQALVKGRVHAKQVSRSIGFSYHNHEQDMFWARSLEWLKQNHPDEYELYYAFGRNAYLKTRNTDGNAAFEHAASIKPARKIILKLSKTVFCLRAAVRSCGKLIYLKLRA